jgi:MerR family transcriptional regulator, light-induced transcriptional regulator
MEGNSAIIEPGARESTHTKELVRELAERIDGLDRPGAIAIALGAVAEGRISVPDLYVQVLTPYLADIGTHWRRGSARVWHERFATNTVRTIIESLYPAVAIVAAETPSMNTAVVLACPPSEQHDLGLRMLSDRFELAGYHSVFLGADTPAEEIAAAAIATDAKIVVLSVATLAEKIDIRSISEVVREIAPGASVRLTGPAIESDPSSQFVKELLDPAEFDLPGTALTD